MSVQAIEIAFRTEVASAVHKLVLVALADGTPLEGIAARCGLEADHAAEVIQELQDAGHVAMTAQGPVFRDRASWVSTNGERYREALCRCAP
jgi:hypothetical protein